MQRLLAARAVVVLVLFETDILSTRTQRAVGFEDEDLDVAKSRLFLRVESLPFSPTVKDRSEYYWSWDKCRLFIAPERL